MWNLLAEHVTSVYRFALRLGCDTHTAEDIAQESFVRAWKNRGALRDPRAARIWLLSIAANVWRDHARRERLREESLREIARGGAPANAAVERVTIDRDELQAIVEAVDGLPPRQRQVMYLHAFENLSHAEIARVLAMSGDAVKVHLSEARRALRSRLEGLFRSVEGRRC